MDLLASWLDQNLKSRYCLTLSEKAPTLANSKSIATGVLEKEES